MELAGARPPVGAVTRRAVYADTRRAPRFGWPGLARRRAEALRIARHRAWPKARIPLTMASICCRSTCRRRSWQMPAWGAGNAVGGDASNRGVVGDREVDRIAERYGSAALAVAPWQPAQFFA